MFSVIDYFEDTCKKYKDKVAVICENEKITYQELNNITKKIGSYLSKYISINEPVIVFMNKGIEALEAFLAILRAGGCYSLVNPEFPKERIWQIRNILNAKVIIANPETYELANELFKESKVLNILEIDEKVDDIILNSIKDKKIDLDPVYINFTSGSTGVPKGVVVGNRSIIDFINEFTKNFDINENDIIANQAPFDFDVSVKDIYSALFKGSTLLIVPKEYFSNPAKLLDYLIDNKVTTLIWAVSALCLITTFHGLDYKVPTSVNKVIFSGEVMPIKHLNKWMEKLDKAMFVNVYGPTEITCNCTYHIIDKNRKYDGIIPIGKPFKNERVFLLDENNNEVTKKDTLGEICVAGTCLSLGYYNNEEQNNKHFMNNPLNNMYYERIYKTGDYGKYNDLNELVFGGRKDFQVKYMGHRIELEEIEREINKIEEVERCCVIYIEEKSKMYAFFIGDIEKDKLKIELTNKLPVYMVPSKFIKESTFPLTKNGKIDRKELLKRI